MNFLFSNTIKSNVIKALCVGAVFSVGVFSAPAWAQQVEVDADIFDSGWYIDPGNHTASNRNFISGRFNGLEYRAFHVYSIPDIPQDYNTAVLRFYTHNIEGGPNTVRLLSVDTPVSQLVADGVNQTSIFADLGTGVQYGADTSLSIINTYVEIPLNAEAIAAINGKKGEEFALALYNSTAMLDSDFLFGSSHNNPYDHRIILGYNINTAPIAEAGTDQTTLRPGDLVTLDGSGSTDEDNDPLTYMWTQISGPTVTLSDPNVVNPTFTIPLDAVDTPIVFQLVVNDGTEDSEPDQVTLQAVNEAPIANPGANLTDPRPNSVVTLDGTASSDPDGDALTYMWTQVSGPPVTLDDVTSATPSFTIPLEAVDDPVIFELIVNDGFEDSEPVTVSIMAQNEAPVAEAGVDQDNVIPGNSINLDGTGSSDADGDPLTYMWTQVSGTPVTFNDPTSATPAFEAPGGGGALVFQLVVNDGFVDSAPDTVTITVQDNVAVTTKAIGDFLTARNALILSHQPDLQRRIDRLQGRGGSRSVSSVNGIPVPGTQNLPVQLAMNGSNTQLSGSLSGLKNTDGKRKVSEPGSFDIWGEAYISSFNIDQRSGNFGIYYLGGDYLVNENLLVGVLGQLDSIDYDDNFQVGVLDGEGWMAGPYVTARLSDNLYADGRITYGTSDNTIAPFGTYVDSFETSRYLFAGSLTGEFDLSEKFTLRPEGGVTYLTEKQDSYVDALGSTIPSQSSEQGQFNLGPRLHYNYMSDNGFSFRPFFEVEGIYSFGDGIDTVIGDDTRLRLEGGADIFTGGGLRLSGSYFKDGIGADNYDADGFRITGGFTF